MELNEERERLIIPDEDGEEHLFETLFKFDVDELNASYICLVPVEQVDTDEAEVYAFRYEETATDSGESDINLFPIESDEEWEIVEEMFATLVENEDDDHFTV